MKDSAVATGIENTQSTISKRHNHEEKNILEVVDQYLEKMETKLNDLENYFTNRSKNRDSIDSLADQGSKQNQDEQELVSVYQTLKLMKQSVFESTSSKLDAISTFFSENYASLIDNKGNQNSQLNHDDDHDQQNIYNQIITGLEYLDTKINQMEQIIGNFQPVFNIDDINYYNYDAAVMIGETKYLHYYQLPFVVRENRFIIFGYRFMGSNWQLIKSVFRFPLNNESLNVWSHLGGALYVLYLAFFHFPQSLAYKRGIEIYNNSPNAWISDNVFIYIFLFASFNCLISSSLMHTFTGTCHINFRNQCNCLDYSGITLLIAASILTAQYCSLYYLWKFQFLSISITGSLSAIGFFLSWKPEFDRPEGKALRVAFFIILATSGITCFIVSCFYIGFFRSFSFFSSLFPSFISYIIGVMFYSLLIPERWRSDVVLDEQLPDLEGLYKTIHQQICNKRSHKHTHSLFSNSSKEDEEKIVKEAIINSTFLQKHFSDKPVETSNFGRFTSLWWSDYFSSHCIWHLFVLSGVVCHYFGIIEMFSKIDQNQI